MNAVSTPKTNAAEADHPDANASASATSICSAMRVGASIGPRALRSGTTSFSGAGRIRCAASTDEHGDDAGADHREQCSMDSYRNDEHRNERQRDDASERARARAEAP